MRWRRFVFWCLCIVSIPMASITNFALGSSVYAEETQKNEPVNGSISRDLNNLLKIYIIKASKRASFDIKSRTFINVRFIPGENNDNILAYVSLLYKFYEKQLNLSQYPGKNTITIFIARNSLKDARNGVISGLKSDMKFINPERDFCFVEALHEKNTPYVYSEAVVLLDQSMNGNNSECIRESIIEIFGFYYSFDKFINSNPFYANRIIRDKIEEYQSIAIRYRDICSKYIETPAFGDCIREEFKDD